MNRIRVLLADENEDFLRGLWDWLTSEPGVELVGAAMTGTEALALAEELSPDVVLVDAGIHEPNGFELTRRIKALPDSPMVVLESFHDNRTMRLEAARAGADGFVGKADVADRLLSLLAALGRPSTVPRKTESKRSENSRALSPIMPGGKGRPRLERKDRRES